MGIRGGDTEVGEAAGDTVGDTVVGGTEEG